MTLARRTLSQMNNQFFDTSPGDTVTRTMEIPSVVTRPVPGQLTPSLLVVSGRQAGRAFPIFNSEFLIGRGRQCDLSMDEESISRHHCKIVTENNETLLIDLGSTNGTYLNGKRVTSSSLQNGDQFQLGTSAMLKYQLRDDVEARFMSELYDAATKDYLTGIYNKKYFMDRLKSEFAYAKRHETRLSLLAIDLDHFKDVNDTYGHYCGDVALRTLAQHFLEHTRMDDLVARVGGEEFMILLRDCKRERAIRLAENLRQQAADLSIEADGKVFHVTVSMGVATLHDSVPGKAAHFDSLIKEADNKLYQAKHAGRNRVCA
jgi:diguanylate cyclase (GGDEF)-like protein